MASRAQDAWIQLLFATGVGVRARESTLGRAADTDWIGATGPTRRSPGSRSDSQLVGGLWVQISYALIDIICVAVNGTLAFFFRFSLTDLRRFFVSGKWAVTTQQPLSRYGAFLLLYAVLIVLFCQWQDLYCTPRTRSSGDETLAVSKSVFLSTLLLAAFVFLSGVKIVSRLVVMTCFLLNVITLAAWRYAKRQMVIRRAKRGIGTRNTVIIGAGRVGQALAQQFEENKLLGYQFVGFLDGNHVNDPRLLGKIEDLPRVARSEFVDEVFVTIPSERELVKRIALQARQSRLAVKVVPDLYDGLAWNTPIRHIGDFPAMDLCWKPIPTFGLFVKRILDAGLSAAGLIVCLPLLGALAVWIKLDSPGPVVYSSRRVGKKGRVFTCFKLRTMVSNADALKDSLRHRNERTGPFFKIANDPRLTRAGAFLRKYSLDELPQLWNVLKGDMTLVGPRPHPVDDYEQYSLDDLRRLEVKPGITGLWQVTARQDPSFDAGLRLDLEYIDEWSLLVDLQILLKTAVEISKGSGQ
jgi:exopolysaccharide biosynthesis polyprenyl glycosylphosphotransferase